MNLIESIFNNDLDSIALICEAKSLSYREFYSLVDLCQEDLIGNEVLSGNLYPLYDEQGIDYIVKVMALLKIGAHPVLLPQTFPKDEALKLFDSMKHIELEPKDAFVVFTSGTTGTTKGVILTKENLWCSAKGTNEFFGLSKNDCWTLNLPLYHIGGIMIPIRAMMASGSFSITQDLKNSTFISLVPTQLQRLIEDKDEVEKLREMKLILLGGSAISQNLFKKIKDLKIPVALTYGSTESCAQLTSQRPFDYLSDQGEVLPFRELKIENEKIKIGGQTLFRAYIKNGVLEFPFDSEGFFETGDLGRLESSRLKVFGRSDLCFISGGENINPIMVENIILESEQIEDALVTSIEDEKFGEVGVAFIKGDVTPSVIIEQLRNRVARFMIPKYFLRWKGAKGLKTNRKEMQLIACKWVMSDENKL